MANIPKNERTKWENGLYIYEAAMEILKTKIKLLSMEYGQLVKKSSYTDIQKIEYRLKTPESIADKLEKKSLPFTTENISQYIHDVVGGRIVCLTLTDVYAIVDLLTKTIDNTEGFELVKAKDYIKNPKPSGYQSYHMNIIVPVQFSEEKYKIAADIHIRTTAMDAWATLEHKLGYKPSKDLTDMSEILKAQFEAYAKMVESTDRLVAAASESGIQKIKK